MPEPADVVFLFDCDNTLLDNDAMQDALRGWLVEDFGREGADRYWAGYEALRHELGYADYLGALQRFRRAETSDIALFELSSHLLDFPFAAHLYPGAVDVVRHVQQWGPAVILSDGDVVFQPRKLWQSGLWNAVQGRVLIYVHKEERLDAVAALYPAHHYVMVDDKPLILAAMKRQWQERLTTIFPRQGHYAQDPRQLIADPAPDIAVDRIGELLSWTLAQWING